MTDSHYEKLRTKVESAVEIKRVCDCISQFKDTSLPGCKVFTKKPDDCWCQKNTG